MKTREETTGNTPVVEEFWQKQPFVLLIFSQKMINLPDHSSYAILQTDASLPQTLDYSQERRSTRDV